MKQELFEHTLTSTSSRRVQEYRRLMDDPAIVEQELLKGAEKAREISVPFPG